MFFESGEPRLDEVSAQEFLDRFPEGKYRFFGRTVDGKFVKGRAEFTHVVPCAPVIVSAGLENGDFIIRWAPVTQVVDPAQTNQNEVVCVDPEDLGIKEFEIDGYEVVVEGEDGDFSIKLPSDADSVTVPPEAGTVEKLEVLAIEASGNQTITELVLVEQPE